MTRLYRWIVLVSSLMLWVGSSAPPAQAVTARPQEVAPPVQRPLIFVRSSHAEPGVVAAGETVELFVELHNVGAAGAINVLVSFVSTDFVPEGTSSRKSVSSLQPNEHATVSQTLRAVSGAGGGPRAVTLQITYDDATGYSYTGSEVVGLNVLEPTPTPKAGRPQLVIDSVALNPALPVPGEPFTLTLTLHNVGTGSARGVLLTHSTPSSFAPLGVGNVIAVGAIGWQESIQAPLRLVADRASEAGVHVHPILLEYDSWSGEHLQSQQNIAIELDKPPAAILESEPLVVLEEYRVEPETLAPGQPFLLTLRIRNVGESEARQVTLTMGGQVDPSKSAPIAPLGTGNVRYLPAMAPGEVAELGNQFIVDGNATTGVYLLGLGFEFTGSAVKPLLRSEQISLVVLAQPQVLVSFYQPVQPEPPGQPVALPIEILNLGRNRLNSTLAEVLSEELDIELPSGYLGPIDPGSSVSLDAMATAATPGTRWLTVRIHYFDEFNQFAVLDRELSIEVSALPELGGKPEPGEGNGPNGEPGPLTEAPARPWVVRLLRGLFGLGSA